MKKTTTKKRVSTKGNAPAAFQTGADLKSAVLVISLLLNLAVFCLWLTLQVTSKYDDALTSFFLNR